MKTSLAKVKIIYWGKVLESVREQTESLDLINKDIERISDIEGLELLPKLEVLDLSDNHIGKLDGLERLGNLRSLYLQGNQISRMGDLSELKNLWTLSLDDNKIRRIEGLDWLKELDELDLINNPVEKIEGLETLGNLTVLALDLAAIPLVKAAGLHYEEKSIDGKPYYILVDAQGAVGYCQRMDIERKKPEHGGI
jgi:Leucine-rich repeat (LRR) protein